MGTSSGSDSGSSGAVTADYYGPDSSLVDEVALTGVVNRKMVLESNKVNLHHITPGAA